MVISPRTSATSTKPTATEWKSLSIAANKPCKRHYLLALRSGQKKDIRALRRALNKDLLMENNTS